MDIRNLYTDLPEEYKRELTFDINNRKNTKELTDYRSVMQNFSNLLLMVPGTYPDTPLMGVNLKKYQFNFLTDTTISNITSEIKQQVAIYLPNLNLINLELKKVLNEKTAMYDTLMIGIKVQALGNDDLVDLFVQFTQDSETNEILILLNS